MSRPPFSMKASRSAVVRCDGRFLIAGRASFCWETLLQRRASGVPGVHEIRRGEHGSPWHRVELTIDEAETLLAAWGVFGARRVGRARRLRESRVERGLEVA